MLQFIMEKNVLLYLLAAACAVGVVSQMILRQIYDGLIKDTKNAGEPGGRFLQQLRQRFQYCAHLNEQVGDVQALIQKSVMEYRVWGISLHGWRRIAPGCLAVSLLCALAGTLTRMQGGAEIVAGNVYFWMGAGAALLTAIAYGIADTGYRDRTLFIYLCDYLGNSGLTGSCRATDSYSRAAEAYSGAADSYSEEDDIPELAYEAAATRTPIVSVSEGRRTKRRAKAEMAAAQSAAQKDRSELTRAQKEKNELKENLSRVKAGMQESAASDADRPGSGRGADLLRQMDQKEQERIVREVLKEFLSH